MDSVLPTSCSIRTGMQSIKKWSLGLDSPIRQLVENAGFGWCTKLQLLKADKTLICALIHFYDSETCSFIINNQNYMISLEDILYLTGLNVDGPPIAPKEGRRQEYCNQLLGLPAPHEGQEDKKRKGTVSLDWLVNSFRDVDINDSEERKIQCARAHILYCIGTCILPYSLNGRVQTIYLDLLRDFELINNYSWGSAMLALLLHSLKNIKPGKEIPIVHGNGILLQVWAYEHFKLSRPENLLVAPRQVPLMEYWSIRAGKISHNNHAKKTSSDWVEKLNGSTLENVDFKTYNDLVLPEGLIPQLPLKKSRTVIISLDRYVWLRPDNCPLQFGGVTNNLGEIPDFGRTKKRRGSIEKDLIWRDELEGPVNEWNRRWETLISVSSPPPSPASAAHNKPFPREHTYEDLPCTRSSSADFPPPTGCFQV